MALPKVNVLPKYTDKIPSTGKQITFRPYLIKEEKILLLAAETNDEHAVMTAIMDMVLSCINEDVDRSSLTTFDVEYLFMSIRAKAVGEKAPVHVKCSSCDHMNEVVVDVTNIKKPEGVKSNSKIELTDKVALKMSWPKYEALIENQVLSSETSKTKKSFEIVMMCMDTIMFDNEVYVVKDTPREEVVDFIENLTAEQYKKIVDFMETIPTLEQEISFNCTECGTHNKTSLSGIMDFF